jgi:hypothetical protein
MARTSQQRQGTKRSRSAGKRDLVSRPKASAYAKRTTAGRFKEMDDVGRSQKADKPRKAKARVPAGYGDQGDRSRKQRLPEKTNRVGYALERYSEEIFFATSTSRSVTLPPTS